MNPHRKVEPAVADLEEAWRVWSAGIQKVGERVVALLRAAFSAAARAGFAAAMESRKWTIQGHAQEFDISELIRFGKVQSLLQAEVSKLASTAFHRIRHTGCPLPFASRSTRQGFPDFRL